MVIHKERVLYMSLKEELHKYWKVEELRKFAAELGIKNRSKMNKEELIEAIISKLNTI
jgi:phage gp16-like protein